MHCWWIVFSFNVSSISSTVDWWSLKTNLRDFSWILFIFLISPLDVTSKLEGSMMDSFDEQFALTTPVPIAMTIFLEITPCAFHFLEIFDLVEIFTIKEWKLRRSILNRLKYKKIKLCYNSLFSIIILYHLFVHLKSVSFICSELVKHLIFVFCNSVMLSILN